MQIKICLWHTHRGNLYHPLGQHSYGYSTAGWCFLPVPSLNIRLIAGEGEQALQPGKISKKTAYVGNNMTLCWLCKHIYIRHLRQSGGKKNERIKFFRSVKERGRERDTERLSPSTNLAMTQPLFFIIPAERNIPARNCFDLKLSITNTFKIT